MKTKIFLLLVILVAAALPAQGANPFADTKSKAEALAAFEDVEKQLVKKDANGLRSLYEAWKVQYKISYAPDEDGQRYANFEATLRRIIKTNRDTRRSYWASLNQFSAMTDKEFQTTFATSLQRQDNGTASAATLGGRRSLLALPNSKNWVLEGKVTPVKNQGSCGCCWAFAGTAAIESRALIALRKKASTYNIDLSEQQIVDCAKGAPYFPYSFGCRGGQLQDPFRYSARGFQAPESLYAYTKREGGCRRVAATSGRVTLSGAGYTNLPMYSGTALKQALLTSPLSIGYYSSERSFRDYKGGVYNPSRCGTPYLVDHAVLLVGYDNIQKSWLFKNSWGPYWGEKGFFRMAMKPDGTQGTCQMYTWAVQPTNLKYPAPM